MNDSDIPPPSSKAPGLQASNKGKLTGPKPPLRPGHVWLIGQAATRAPYARPRVVQSANQHSNAIIKRTGNPGTACGAGRPVDRGSSCPASVRHELARFTGLRAPAIP